MLFAFGQISEPWNDCYSSAFLRDDLLTSTLARRSTVKSLHVWFILTKVLVQIFLKPVTRVLLPHILKHFAILLSFHVYLDCLSPPVNCMFMFCNGNLCLLFMVLSLGPIELPCKFSKYLCLIDAIVSLSALHL